MDIPTRRFFVASVVPELPFSLTPVNSWQQLYTTNSKLIYRLAGCLLIDIGICVLWFMDEDIPRIVSRIAFTTQIATNCCNWLCHFNKLTLLCLFANGKHSIKTFTKSIKNFCLKWNDFAAEQMWLKAIISRCNLWSQYNWGLDHDIIHLEHLLFQLKW